MPLALPILNEEVAQGFAEIPTFNTSVIRSKGGGSDRNQEWSLALPRYRFSFNAKPIADILALREMFYDRRGRFLPFLLKVWTHYSVTDETIGTGDGADTTWQAIETLSAGFNAYTLTLNYLKQGTLIVKVNNVTQTETTHYSVNYDTGLITFVTAPPNGQLIKITTEFYRRVFFTSDEFPIESLGPNALNAMIGEITVEEEAE